MVNYAIKYDNQTIRLSMYHQRPRKKNIQIQEEILPIISGLRLYSNQKGKKPNKILTLSPILLINALEDALRKNFEI